MKTNHENFPGKIDELIVQLGTIRELLKLRESPKTDAKVLNLDNAMKFLSEEGYTISKSAIYKLTSTSAIPFKRFGNKLLFDKEDLLQWCKSKTSNANLERDVIVNLASMANKKCSHGK